MAFPSPPWTNGQAHTEGGVNYVYNSTTLRWDRAPSSLPVPATISVTGVNSVSGGGDLTANRTLQLVNDAAAPGNSKYYGTNASGSKGFFDLPAGGGGSAVADGWTALSGSVNLTTQMAAGKRKFLIDTGGTDITVTIPAPSSIDDVVEIQFYPEYTTGVAVGQRVATLVAPGVSYTTSGQYPCYVGNGEERILLKARTATLWSYSPFTSKTKTAWSEQLGNVWRVHPNQVTLSTQNTWVNIPLESSSLRLGDFYGTGIATICLPVIFSKENQRLGVRLGVRKNDSTIDYNGLGYFATTGNSYAWQSSMGPIAGTTYFNGMYTVVYPIVWEGQAKDWTQWTNASIVLEANLINTNGANVSINGVGNRGVVSVQWLQRDRWQVYAG